VGDCATRPVSVPRHCAAYSCTAGTPRPRSGAGGTLEPLSRDYAGSNHDVKPAGAPSPPLLRHAAHCYNCSNTIEHTGTGRRHACHCTSYGPLSTAPSSPLEAAPVNHYASNLEAAPVLAQDAPRRRDWSKIRQDGHQLYGVVRHTATRRKIVRHACKSPSPWPIKGRRPPSRKGRITGRRTAITHTLSAFSTILALASISTPGTWRPRPLSHHACSHPSTSTSVQRNTVPRAHHCWTYGPSRNQDKPSVITEPSKG
jgi:hypothetical protein